VEIDKYKGGIVFKWLNKTEIYQKYNQKGRKVSLQAYIDKLHVEYCATRSGVDMGDFTHGLFGNILNTDEVEYLELEKIKSYVQEISSKNIDIFKTSISLKGEDAINHNFVTKQAWKDLIEEKIPEIAKGFKISINDLEWVAAFHSKEINPHCHLIVWNKNQDLSVNRKPYINFIDIKKAIAKGVYKEELKAMYDIKDISKENVGNLAREEIMNYKELIKSEYKNENISFKLVETKKTKEFIDKAIKEMNINETIYIVNDIEPENYTMIVKENENNYLFENIGKSAILYKENNYMDAVAFLSRFSNLNIIKTKTELDNYILKKNNEIEDIESELKEIIPDVFNIPALKSKVNNEYIKQIIMKISELEKVTNSYEKGFIYKYQIPDAKKVLDEISHLIMQSNTECKKEFSEYVNTCIKIDKILQKINTKEDYNKTKDKAEKEMIKKIGNQILKIIKENKTEEYQRKCKEWKEKKEYWNQTKKEIEENKGEYEARQQMYDKQLQEINIRNLIKDTYKLLIQENMAKSQRCKRATKTFGDLSKREIKEIIRKNKTSGFDWYNER